MVRRLFLSICLVFAAGIPCHADLTLRYTTDLKTGSGMPPAAMEAMKQQFHEVLPKERVLRFKGDKTISDTGGITSIVDSARGEVILLNPATKQYAQIAMVDYLAAVQAGMPQASVQSPALREAMARMKVDVQSSNTGQIAMVFGIRAEEHLTTMTVSMDLPGMAAPSVPVTRIEMRTWLAIADDISRIPGLREYTDRAQRAMATFNSADQMQKLFSQLPGVGDKMSAAMVELTKNAGSLTVKMHQAIYMPMMSQLAQGPKPDTNTPFMEMNMDLAELSVGAIDDSVFQVPVDYQMAPAAELIRAMFPVAPKQPNSRARTLGMSSTPPVRLALAPGEQISRVGGGVSAPVVLDRHDPEYTEEARSASLSGTVLLSVVVDRDGVAKNIQVVRPLGMGLDEKAVEAVSQWKFRPGQKDGTPVNVAAQIEVNFRLLVDPPKE